VIILTVSLLTIILVPTILVKCWDGFIDNKAKEIIVEVRTDEGEIKEIVLEEYLKGVVAAEMPASFKVEALKAQAVAARTYILRKLQGSTRRRVKITTDINLDQAWISKEEMIGKWGKFNYYFKISKAVEETEGIFLAYQGKAISAVYHSASGDMTEDSENVWGRDLPYLKSVKSYYEIDSPYNRYFQDYSLNEFIKKIGLKKRLDKSDLGNLINILSRSKSGRVLEVKVLNKVLTGRELRKRLGLKSTNFKYQLMGNNIRFITSGNGHGVGLSQYGANGMAKRGYNYFEILSHYYSGVEFRRMNH
jgi:stage II sporulation protein D